MYIKKRELLDLWRMANHKVENELVVINDDRILEKEVWKIKLHFCVYNYCQYEVIISSC